jgi:hypothetical protein
MQLNTDKELTNIDKFKAFMELSIDERKTKPFGIEPDTTMWRKMQRYLKNEYKMKCCKSCYAIKPIVEFRNSANTNNGNCKPCNQARLRPYQREYRRSQRREHGNPQKQSDAARVYIEKRKQYVGHTLEMLITNTSKDNARYW